MSCVLYDTEVHAVEAVEVDVVVEHRIASGTVRCEFPDPGSGAPALAVVLPDDTSVVDLRYAEGFGPWVRATAQVAEEPADLPDRSDPSEVLGGNLFTIVLPELSGQPLVVELAWQGVLAATSDALAVSVPVDDAGLSPTAPMVRVSFDVESATTVLSATSDLAPPVVDGDSVTASYTGVDPEGPIALSWIEATAPFGVQVIAFRPAVDPYTGARDAGYAVAVVQPGLPTDDARVDRLFTFVLDTSASMAGAPLDAAVAAGSAWLRELDPADRFDVVAYGSQALAFRGIAPQADPEAIDRGVAFLEAQTAMGLSDPAEALVTALALADDTVQQRSFFGCDGTSRPTEDAPPLPGQPITTADGRRARVAPYVVLLTDGGATTGVTGASEIAALVAEANTVEASIYAIGVGPDADRALLERLASDHRGEARFVDGPDGVEVVVEELAARIRDPVLVRPKLWVPGATDLAPARLPDVAAGHEVLVAFRFTSSGEQTLTLQGVRGQDDVTVEVPVVLPETDERFPAAATAWAMLRVRDLDAAYAAGDDSVYPEIRRLVETYGVASRFVTLGFDDADEDAPAYAFDGAAACGCRPPAIALAGGLPLLLALGAVLTRRRACRRISSRPSMVHATLPLGHDEADMARLGLAALTVVALASHADALAFGGAVVTDGEHTVSSEAARLVYVRTGATSHLTMSAQVAGDATSFALVIPVPEPITADDVASVSGDAVEKIDRYSAPRLLGYTCEDLYPWLDDEYYDYYYYDDYWYDYGWDANRRLFGNNWGRGPFDCTGSGCGGRPDRRPYYYDYGWYDYDGDTAGGGDTGGGSSGGEVVGVAVTDQFTAGEYAVSVLTAEESAALADWLAAKGLVLGDEAAALAQGYIDQGWAFVVAEVTLEAPPVAGDWLTPLRISYATQAMTFPLRMGLASGGPEMDLQLWTVTDYDDGRASVANYESVSVEEQCMWDPSLQADAFDEFYQLWIDDELGGSRSSYAAWAREFSWSRGDCDPCTDGPLTDADLEAFGWDTDVDNAFVTRLKLRYTADELDQDPVLATNRTRAHDQLEFVAYEPSLEQDFPVCGEGWVDNAQSCFDGTPRERQRRPRRILSSGESSVALAGLALLGGLFLRRQRRGVR